LALSPAELAARGRGSRGHTACVRALAQAGAGHGPWARPGGRAPSPALRRPGRWWCTAPVACWPRPGRSCAHPLPRQACCQRASVCCIRCTHALELPRMVCWCQQAAQHQAMARAGLCGQPPAAWAAWLHPGCRSTRRSTRAFSWAASTCAQLQHAAACVYAGARCLQQRLSKPAGRRPPTRTLCRPAREQQRLRLAGPGGCWCAGQHGRDAAHVRRTCECTVYVVMQSSSPGAHRTPLPAGASGAVVRQWCGSCVSHPLLAPPTREMQAAG
jgi:hypothetical protein